MHLEPGVRGFDACAGTVNLIRAQTSFDRLVVGRRLSVTVLLAAQHESCRSSCLIGADPRAWLDSPIDN